MARDSTTIKKELSDENSESILETIENDSSWLSELKLLSFEPLLQLDKRTLCSQCNSNRKYFCYDCCIPMGDPKNAPALKLPISVDIIHFPTELISKSTAMHAKVISHKDVNIIEYSPSDLSEYDIESTILLYPTNDASAVKDLELDKIKKVVFIDSQWRNARKILEHPNIKKIKCIKIDQQKTLFWRYQNFGDSYLATIEAIYYFFKEFHQAGNNGQYDGRYDNLLYYYAFFYNLIQNSYKSTNRVFYRKDNYVINSSPSSTSSDQIPNDMEKLSISNTTNTTDENGK
eukprot:gene5688-7078_t